jgi:flavin reductase (DIM6/NTAB) family NADH-FMN oxidoreductase RutF
MLTAFPKEYEGTEIMLRSGVFGLSMAAADQEEFHDHFFSGKQSIKDIGEDKFFTAETGSPLLKDAVAYFDCKVVQTIDNGDFVLAIGDIVKGEALHPEKKTLDVVYLSRERTSNYSVGPLTLPHKGFDVE